MNLSSGSAAKIRLLLSVLVALSAGAVGSAFTFAAIPGWYAALVRPDIAPPNGVFGPVWTTLYVLMGIAAWLVYERTAGAARRRALSLYALQLILNAGWSVVFFGLHMLGLALVEIALLWLAIAATIADFARVSRAAAWLLAPYLAWVSFAAYLNYLFWALNR